MKKLSKNKLFNLISRLTRSERGYISKMLQVKASDSNLFRLFNYFCRINKFDQNKLRKHFQDAPFSKNLSVTQNHLYDTILKTMRLYHAKKNDYKKILGVISDIEFLYEKGLLKDAEKMLDKALEKCMSHDFYGLALHLLHWKRIILHTNIYFEGDIGVIAEEAETTVDIFQKLRQIQDLMTVQLEVSYFFFHKKSISSEDTIRSFADQKKKAILQIAKTNTELDSDLAKLIFTNIKTMLAFAVGDMETIMQSFEEKPLNGRAPAWNSINEVVKMEMTRVGFSLLFDKIEHLEPELRGLEKLYNKHFFLSEHANNDKILLTYRIQFCYLRGMKADPKVLKRITGILAEDLDQLQMASWMCFHLSRYFFTVGNFDEALTWNLKALNQSVEIARNFNYICRFHSAMIYLQLEQYNKLQVCVRDLYRFLKRKERVMDYEKALISFFKNAQKNWGRMNQKDILSDFNETMFPHFKVVNRVFRYLELFTWMEASQKGLTVLEYKKRDRPKPTP